MNDVLYVIVNKSLNMSPGKAAAQVAHAVMGLENRHRTNFVANKRRTVIVLEAKDREQLDGIADYLSDYGVDYNYYIDEGVNEVLPFSLTAMAIEPLSAEDPKREIFSELSLYGSNDEDCNKQSEGDYYGETESELEFVMRSIRESTQEIRSIRQSLNQTIEKVTEPKRHWWQRKKVDYVS